MHPCLFWLPLLEEGQHGTCRRSIHSLKELLMQLPGRSEALQCIPPLFLCLCRVVLFISNTQEIGSSITEEISWRLPPRPRWMIRYNHLTRTDDRLLALTLFFSQVIDTQELSILRQVQSKGYAHRTPAAPRRITFLCHCLIAFCQCLKNHLNTSTPRKSSTPSRSTARKNCGRICAASE